MAIKKLAAPWWWGPPPVNVYLASYLIGVHMVRMIDWSDDDLAAGCHCRCDEEH
jgi:hypothetical protein